MHPQIDTIDDADERAAAEEWCEWAEVWLSANEPFKSRRSGMPQVPEPRDEDLTPFLRGLSPYGPGVWP